MYANLSVIDRKVISDHIGDGDDDGDDDDGDDGDDDDGDDGDDDDENVSAVDCTNQGVIVHRWLVIEHCSRDTKAKG